MKPFRIGAGAGFAGDRFDGADLLAESGTLDSLVFECLAERTIGLATLRKHIGSGVGFDPLLLKRLENTLPQMHRQGGSIITNAGAADPLEAGRAAKQHHPDVRIASVLGDDVLAKLSLDSQIIGTSDSLGKYSGKLLSANAYLGSSAIVEALNLGAELVITGRCSDASLFLAPLAHNFGWDNDQQIAAGILVGHLLECAGQISGGYFADQGKALVPNLANLGFPFADVSEAGHIQISKLPATGGLITRETVLEQLLYEVTDPHNYVTPDLTVDFSGVQIQELEENLVSVSGARPVQVPENLKVSVGIDDGFAVKGEILYGGPSSLFRAQLAAEIICERWAENFGRTEDLTIEYLGYNATRPWSSKPQEPTEVCLRIGTHTFDEPAAQILCREIEALYLNGPAGGGGANAKYSRSVGVVSILMPRSEIETEVRFHD